MKKASFSLAEASKKAPEKDLYERATEELKKYESLFRKFRGIVTGYWIASKDNDLYIMVSVEKDKVRHPEKLIPNKLGRYDVYYIEGHSHY